MEIMEIRQKISNHPINEGIERDVVIRRIADNADVKVVLNRTDKGTQLNVLGNGKATNIN